MDVPVLPGLAAHARQQYAGSTANLDARVALHQLYSTATMSWPRWVFDRLALAQGDRVLEVGAGTGQLWTATGDRLPANTRLWLTDASPVMCRQLAVAVPGAVVLQADAQQMPFRGGVADVAVACHMLYHVPDRLAALRELARVLRPGGRVAVATNGRQHMREIRGLLTMAGVKQGPPMHAAFTLEDTPALISQVFDDVLVVRYHDSLRVTEPEPLLAYLESVSPLTARQRAAAERAVMERMTSDAVHVTKVVGLLTGVRR